MEKRLKLEHHSDPKIPVIDNNLTPTESLSSPIYLHLEQTSNNNNNSNLHESSSSEPPQEFLSLSPQFQPTQRNPPQIAATHVEETGNIDDIRMLMELLALSDYYGEKNGRQDDEIGDCECEGGFFEKIVGFKGPKCEKEVQRMESWIKYLLKNGEEPLRLGYLLLGKAAFALDGEDCGFGGLEFASTIDDFLKNDPPRE